VGGRAVTEWFFPGADDTRKVDFKHQKNFTVLKTGRNTNVKRKNPKNPSEAEPISNPLSRRDFLKIAGVAAGAAAASQIPGSVLAAAGPKPPKPPITTPTITCAPNGTDGTSVIDIRVCAPSGGTGLPAGFSVQWMTCDAFDNGTTIPNPLGPSYPDIVINYPGQWPADSDAAAAAGVLCKSSFSGNAHDTQYNLAAAQCKTVYAGTFSNEADPNNPDNNPSLGYSTSCPGPLDCDTCYVFRAFGHATSTYKRSEYSLNCESTTDACEELHDGIDDASCNPPTGSGCATPLTASTVFPAGSAALVNGKTVQQILDEANNVLNGGTPTLGLTASQLNDLCTRLNESFDGGEGTDGTCCGATYFGLGHLFVGGCPA
jgi:hypothetical protein